MKTVHDFLDRSAPIPPVNVENVDVRRTKLLQTGLDTDVQRLRVVSRVVDFLTNPFSLYFEVRGILENISALHGRYVATCMPSWRLRVGRECPSVPSIRQ